jgi:UDP-N-acetylglucosamine/UDP-N-acetylgalactosamine diphosphorylase
MTRQKGTKIARLIAKGVRIACPESIEIGAEVDIDRISGDGVTIHAGSKIFGDATAILNGAIIGFEAPATVKNCQIGPGVELKGGFFEDAVFLANAKAGLGSHVREASIFEEQASIAHTVGTKHTILFPFVTLGSLINFCDCLMAGGTSRKNHSEVGSSYIHFNFTPNQDKVTASLIGDVPKGVMLNQPPIFLGGQGGLVGPCRLAYGITVAAGTIVRKDELRTERILYGGAPKDGNLSYKPGRYRNEKRVVLNNIIYIANLIALGQWYHQVRRQFISEYFPEMLLAGLEEKLHRAISERVNPWRWKPKKAVSAAGHLLPGSKSRNWWLGGHACKICSIRAATKPERRLTEIPFLKKSKRGSGKPAWIIFLSFGDYLRLMASSEPDGSRELLTGLSTMHSV